MSNIKLTYLSLLVTIGACRKDTKTFVKIGQTIMLKINYLVRLVILSLTVEIALLPSGLSAQTATSGLNTEGTILKIEGRTLTVAVLKRLRAKHLLWRFLKCIR